MTETSSLVVELDADLERARPKCVHGPTLLFRSATDRFFACSACRDRRECDIYVPFEKRDAKASKKIIQQNRIEYRRFKQHVQALQRKAHGFRKQSNVRYCYTCSILFAEGELADHLDHHHTESLARRQLRHPCRDLLQPLENKRTDAQFFFAQSFVDYLADNLIAQGSWDSIICIGCPTVFEHLDQPPYRHKYRSYLLDYDHRLCSFYSSKQMLVYSMFNAHIFSKKKPFQEAFLPAVKSCLLIVDPPFGGFHRALADSIGKLLPAETIRRNIILFNPYFLDKWIVDAFPSLKMLDYKVEYSSNAALHLCRGKKGSPVRMFTDICPSKCPPLDEVNYKYCFECNRYTLLTNQHCFQCQSCTSKDGLPYRHCSLCKRCVKAERVHCNTCNVCHVKDQCMTRTTKRKRSPSEEDQ